MNDYYDYYSYSSPPAYNPVFTIISLVLCVFVLVCMWIIFRREMKKCLLSSRLRRGFPAQAGGLPMCSM